MADRTFESQQYASQEARAGEASLSQGVSALAGAATQAGAALERHGDRMAQREQAGAQMAESRRQADQSAGLRREEMGIQREQLDQQGRQFEMTRSHQMADLQLRQQVDARVAANQAADLEIRNLGVQLQWQDATAARAEAAARWEQDERKLAILSDTRVTAAQLKAQEIQNEMAETQLKAIKEQQAGEYQRGRLKGRTIEQQIKLVDNLSSTLAKLSESVSANPELLKDVASMYKTELTRLKSLLGEAPETDTTPPPLSVDGKQVDFKRFDGLAERSLLDAMRPGSRPANSRVASMLLRRDKDGTKTQVVDEIGLEKWKRATSRMWSETPDKGTSEEAFLESFNVTLERVMQDYNLPLHEALGHMGGAK